MDKTADLLKEFTEACGVPGHEAEVRVVVQRHLQPVGAVTRDHIGSLLCELPGGPERPRVMLVGHMDEIGFMVRHVTPDGFLRFLPLGGWSDQVLLGPGRGANGAGESAGSDRRQAAALAQRGRAEESGREEGNVH